MGSTGIAALIGMYAFAWQIYGDFSGYSSIARGCAQLMGFHFMVNFRQPYLADSIQDFWRRWHISLSTWLRDYLYIPLGGNRIGERKAYRNLLLTMLLGGLWHGANWTFVAWGALHGGGLAVERKLTRGATTQRWRLSRWLKRILIFHFVCLSWIFFRAPSLRSVWAMLKGLGSWSWRPEFPAAFLFLAIFSIPLLLVDLYLEASGEEYCFASATVQARVTFGLACALVIAFLGANQANAFIYFQF
jgi:D-alanyl-lipoteichoic acid acyltransferase DltB (MBOAT superfamily)